MKSDYIDSLTCLTDLHLHLDGAIFLNSVKELALLQCIDLNMSDEQIKEAISVNGQCKNLEDFLSKFDLASSLLQTRIGIKHAVINLLNDLKKQGLMYVEIRFAPQLQTKKGLSQEEAVIAAIQGIKESELNANLILCCMKDSNNRKENIETIELAHKYLNNGVVAIDIAGPEERYPIDYFAYVFELVHKYNIPLTIHAGEDDGPISIINSLKYKPDRIGHGIRAYENNELMNTLERMKLPLEFCPTSNIQTAIFKDIKEYPIRVFLNHNIRICINTDDPAVENTSIKNEYKLLIENFDLSIFEIKQLLINSVNSAFCDLNLKEQLFNKIENEFSCL